MDNLIDDRGAIIQGSAEPAFRCDTVNGINLNCAAGCGQSLIENYYQDSFISVAIKCFTCGHVTVTPNLEAGEVMSQVVLGITDGAKFLLGSSVTYFPQSMLAGSDAIREAAIRSGPTGDIEKLTLDRATLKAIEEKYVAVAGGNYELQRRIVTRGSSRSRFDFPFPWAVMTLEKYLDGDLSRISKSTREAASIITMFSHVYDRWHRSFRFFIVGPQFGLKNNYFHAVLMLMVADTLYSSGNRVGISLDDRWGQPNPDLYIRYGADRKVYVEVKAPQQLQIGSLGDPSILSKKIIERLTHDSSNQIGRDNHGVLLIGSTMLFDKLDDTMHGHALDVINRRGSFHSGLAGIMTFAPDFSSSGGEGGQTIYRIKNALNPHFIGEVNFESE